MTAGACVNNQNLLHVTRVVCLLYLLILLDQTCIGHISNLHLNNYSNDLLVIDTKTKA